MHGCFAYKLQDTRCVDMNFGPVPVNDMQTLLENKLLKTFTKDQYKRRYFQS